MPETGPPAIEIGGLTMSFGDHQVLRGIDLTVPTGSVCALLGPNGAGKTTIVNILSTLLIPDTGSARVTGQFSAFDRLLAGTENLRLMADLRRLGRTAGRRRVDELIDRFDLRDAAGKPASTYSGGMRRKLDLAMTLVARPQV